VHRFATQAARFPCNFSTLRLSAFRSPASHCIVHPQAKKCRMRTPPGYCDQCAKIQNVRSSSSQ
jgi:hypothetical protein